MCLEIKVKLVDPDLIFSSSFFFWENNKETKKQQENFRIAYFWFRQFIRSM